MRSVSLWKNQTTISKSHSLFWSVGMFQWLYFRLKHSCLSPCRSVSVCLAPSLLWNQSASKTNTEWTAGLNPHAISNRLNLTKVAASVTYLVHSIEKRLLTGLQHLRGQSGDIEGTSHRTQASSPAEMENRKVGVIVNVLSAELTGTLGLGRMEGRGTRDVHHSVSLRVQGRLNSWPLSWIHLFDTVGKHRAAVN